MKKLSISALMVATLILLLACSNESNKVTSTTSGTADSSPVKDYPSSVGEFFKALHTVGEGQYYSGANGRDCSQTLLAAFKSASFLDSKTVEVNGHQQRVSYQYGTRFDDDMRSQGHYFTSCKGEILEGDLLHVKRYDQTCESPTSHWLVVRKKRQSGSEVSATNWHEHVANIIDMSSEANFYDGPLRSNFPNRWQLCSCVRHVMFDSHWKILRERSALENQNKGATQPSKPNDLPQSSDTNQVEDTSNI